MNIGWAYRGIKSKAPLLAKNARNGAPKHLSLILRCSGKTFPGFLPILMPLKPTSSSRRARVEEVSEALDRRTGSGLRSALDLEGRSWTMERAHLLHRPPYARRSPGRREPYRQSQAAPAAALPPSKRWSSCIQHKSILQPLRALQRHRPPPALRPPPSNSEELREVKSGHGRAPP